MKSMGDARIYPAYLHLMKKRLQKMKEHTSQNRNRNNETQFHTMQICCVFLHASLIDFNTVAKVPLSRRKK